MVRPKKVLCLRPLVIISGYVWPQLWKKSHLNIDEDKQKQKKLFPEDLSMTDGLQIG
jgi:hypothetical protein